MRTLHKVLALGILLAFFLLAVRSLLSGLFNPWTPGALCLSLMVLVLVFAGCGALFLTLSKGSIRARLEQRVRQYDMSRYPRQQQAQEPPAAVVDGDFTVLEDQEGHHDGGPMCTNCGHPIIYNPIRNTWEHGLQLAISETWCYIGKDCECQDPQAAPRTPIRWTLHNQEAGP